MVHNENSLYATGCMGDAFRKPTESVGNLRGPLGRLGYMMADCKNILEYIGNCIQKSCRCRDILKNGQVQILESAVDCVQLWEHWVGYYSAIMEDSRGWKSLLYHFSVAGNSREFSLYRQCFRKAKTNVTARREPWDLICFIISPPPQNRPLVDGREEIISKHDSYNSPSIIDCLM